MYFNMVSFLYPKPLFGKIERNERHKNIGEFEEIVLLVVASLYDNANVVSIQDEIKDKLSRKITISTAHSTLQ